MITQNQPDDGRKQTIDVDFNWRLKHIETSEGAQFHAVPEDDKKNHLLSTACECNPSFLGLQESLTREWHPLFKHNSYDYREIDEWWHYNIHENNNLHN